MRSFLNKFLLKMIIALVIGVIMGVAGGLTADAFIASPTVENAAQEEQRRVQQEAINRTIDSHKKPDARTRVEDSTKGPYQAVVHLTITYESGAEANCSGFIIAPKVVLTNEHCLVEEATDLRPYSEKARLVTVDPGVNGEFTPPLFGSVQSTQFQVSASGQDYGVIFLPKPLPVVPFGLGEFPHHPESADMQTAGYPGDKDYSTMWESKYHGFAFLDEKRGVISGGEAFGGQSGSPLFQIEEGRFVVKGILWGKTACDDQGHCPLEQVTYFVPFTYWELLEINLWIAMS